MTEPLSRAWEVWAAQNLLRGVPRERVHARLVEEGLGDDEAKAVIDALLESPVMEAARTVSRDARRWRMIARLRQILARRALTPTEVVRRSEVSPEELRDVFRPGNQPVVIPGFASSWPAMQRWQPSALAERFGDVEIATTVSRVDDISYEKSFRRPTERTSVRAYVDRMQSATAGDFYVVAQNHALKGELGGMLDDIPLPPGYLDAPLSERASLWMGPAHTVTTLHFDRIDVLFCQVVGRKRWKLIPPTETALLDRVRGVATLIDAETDPLEGALVKEVTLEPGDALFVPVGWWHHVRALDVSVSLSISLDPEGELEFFRPAEV